MSTPPQNSNSSVSTTSSASNSSNDPIKKFEQISPVLEITYVMIKNIQKYLQVYAKDIGANSLDEYTKTNDALNNVRKILDDIYNISDNNTKKSTSDPLIPKQINNLAPSNIPTNLPITPPVPSVHVQSPVVSTPTQPVPSVTPVVTTPTQTVPSVTPVVPTPTQTVPSVTPVVPTPTQPVPVVATIPVKPEDQKIDSILSELRAIRENSAGSN